MTEFDYPPSRTIALGTALEESDSDDALHQGLEWAVDQFGEDAEIEVTAMTAMRRARIIDTLNQATVGTIDSQQTQTWMTAGSIVSAPWLEGDEDLVEKAQTTGQLPPAFLDWVSQQYAELNELGVDEGN